LRQRLNKSRCSPCDGNEQLPSKKFVGVRLVTEPNARHRWPRLVVLTASLDQLHLAETNSQPRTDIRLANPQRQQASHLLHEVLVRCNGHLAGWKI